MGNFNGTVTVSDSVPQLLNSSNAKVASLTVSLTNGTGTFQVQADQNVGETQTLTAFNLTNGSGVVVPVANATLAITETQAVAAKVGLSIASNQPSSLSANTASETQISVQALDAAGNPATSGAYVTLTLTGPGTFYSVGGPTTTAVFATGTGTTVPVWSETGATGTITVTGASNGLTSGTLTIPTYINTVPASLKITSTSGKDSNGEPYTLYTVQILDTNGNPISSGTGASDSISVTNNASSVNGAIKYGNVSSTGVFTPESTPPTALVNGVASFAVETTTPGTAPATITVTDTTRNLTATATYMFAVGTPVSITVTPTSTVAGQAVNYKTEPGQNVTVQAQLVDEQGNPVQEAGQLVTFTFASSLPVPSGVTLPNGTTSVGYTVPTNAQGVATATIQVSTSAATSGSFIVDASYNGNTVASGTISMVQGINYATQVAITGAPTTSVTGGTTLSTVTTLTAEPENALGGAINPAAADLLQITTSNPNVVALANPDTAGGSTETLPATLNGATNIGGLLTAREAGTATITVQDISNPTQPKATFTVTVVPSGTASLTPAVEYNGQLIGPSNPLNVTANTPVALTVVNVDAGGNPVPVTGSVPLTVLLSDTNGGGFRLTPTGANVTSVQIPIGASSTTVYYANPNTETITGGLTALDAASSVYSTVTPATATTINAGAAIPVTFTFMSPNNTPLNGIAVTFSQSGLAKATFGTSSTATSDTTLTAAGVTGLTTNSSGQVTIYVVDNTAGDSGTVTATAQGLSLTSGTLTTDPVSIGTVTLDPSGATLVGYSTTPGYWLNAEFSNGTTSKLHAVQFVANNAAGTALSGGTVTVTPATGLEVATTSTGTPSTGPISVMLNSSGQGTVYVENAASSPVITAASSATSNGTTAASTTLFNVTGASGALAVKTPGAVTALANFTAGKLVSAATVSATSGETLTIPASALTAPTSGTNYYYVEVAENQPATSNAVWVQIGVAAGTTIGTANYTLTIPTSSSSSTVTITQNGSAVTGVTASIPSWGGTVFTPTKGNIYEIAEVATPVTTAASTAPSATNDGYVRTGP